MSAPSNKDITDLLISWSQGDSDALNELMPLVLGDLRRMASRFFREERSGHTLQPTALVNEVYMRLLDQREVQWNDRAQFFAIAAKIMRRVLVDYARSRTRAKRGGGVVEKIGIGAITNKRFFQDEENANNLVVLDEALGELEKINPSLARIISMRYFGGLKPEEIAEVEELSRATVFRKMRMARAWLVHYFRKNEENQNAV